MVEGNLADFVADFAAGKIKRGYRGAIKVSFDNYRITQVVFSTFAAEKSANCALVKSADELKAILRFALREAGSGFVQIETVSTRLWRLSFLHSLKAAELRVADFALEGEIASRLENRRRKEAPCGACVCERMQGCLFYAECKEKSDNNRRVVWTRKNKAQGAQEGGEKRPSSRFSQTLQTGEKST